MIYKRSIGENPRGVRQERDVENFINKYMNECARDARHYTQVFGCCRIIFRAPIIRFKSDPRNTHVRE